MRPGVPGQVDEFRSFADAANHGLLHLRGIANQRDDAAVVVGIHLAVEEVDAVQLHGLEDGIDLGLIAAFGEVGYTFDECGHKQAG